MLFNSCAVSQISRIWPLHASIGNGKASNAETADSIWNYPDSELQA